MVAQAYDPDNCQEDQELQDQAGLHETVSKMFNKRGKLVSSLKRTTMPT